MTAVAPPRAAVTLPPLAGHTRISTQALSSTAAAAAAEFFGVAPQLIRVAWADDRGLLALSISLPIPVQPLQKVARRPDLAGPRETVLERARAAKPVLRSRVTELTGSIVSRVDIRITGVRVQEGARVR